MCLVQRAGHLPARLQARRVLGADLTWGGRLGFVARPLPNCTEETTPNLAKRRIACNTAIISRRFKDSTCFHENTRDFPSIFPAEAKASTGVKVTIAHKHPTPNTENQKQLPIIGDWPHTHWSVPVDPENPNANQEHWSCFLHSMWLRGRPPSFCWMALA